MAEPVNQPRRHPPWIMGVVASARCRQHHRRAAATEHDLVAANPLRCSATFLDGNHQYTLGIRRT
ncbi:hypothetical protein ABZ639_20300 [Saccharomonospora sp. NPDC006951]